MASAAPADPEEGEEAAAGSIAKPANPLQVMPKVSNFPVPPRKIACGLYHSVCVCNVASTGKSLLEEHEVGVYTWGRNLNNMLAHGVAEADAHMPKAISPEFQPGDKVKVYEVACGMNHTLFLAKKPNDWGGTVWAVGLGNRGRLGVPKDKESEKTWVPPAPLPVQVGPLFERNSVIRICCGADHSLCLTTSGVIYAWGLNSDGQCGVGRTTDVHEPTPIVPLPNLGGGAPVVASFAAGARHSLLVTAGASSASNEDEEGDGGGARGGGFLFTWGCNQQGRLGLGHTTNQSSPSLVETVRDMQLVSAAGGEAHSGAIDAEKKVWMWGVGASGRLGLGDTMDVSTPRRARLPDDVGAVQLALGSFHSLALCVIEKTKRLYSWGSGEAMGLLAEGDNSVVFVPRLVNLGDIPSAAYYSPVQVAAGTYHTLALLENGDIVTFGQGACGRLGTGKTRNYSRPTLVKPRVGYAVKQPDGPLDGKRARFLEDISERNARKALAGASAGGRSERWEIRQLGCGNMHTAALTFGGQLYLWGVGESGQLGFGEDRSSVWTPKLLNINNKVIREIACGHEHCLAVTSGGDIYAWGKGENGQLGIGRNEDCDVPTKVMELKDAVTVAAGDEHSAAICRFAFGTRLYTWGSTASGKLGIEDCFTVAECSPTQVPDFCAGMEDRPAPSAVSCGQYHTAVICSPADASGVCGRVWTFGGGWYGRLGHGSTDNVYTPKMVEELGVMRSVQCGSYHTCAISWESDMIDDPEPAGSLWVWGQASMVCEHTDVKIPKRFQHIDGGKFISVICGHMHTFAVVKSGDVYAWGDNSDGQLGPVTQSSMGGDHGPCVSRLPGQPRVLATGPSHSIAFFKSKDTYSWGNQRGGRLGLEDSTSSKVVDRPAKVKAAWAAIEAMGGEEMEASSSDSDDARSEKSGEEEANAEGNAEGAAEAAAEAGGTANQAEAGGQGAQAETAAAKGKEHAGAGGQKAVHVQDQSDSSKRMLQAIASGQQKVTQFATIQMLLKHEPDASRVHSLRASEAKLSKELAVYIRKIRALPGKEATVVKLQTDLEQSLCANLKFIKKLPGPNYGQMVKGSMAAKLAFYEELIWVLQQQASYLATMSMYLGDKSQEATYFETVRCTFAELDNARVLHLLLAMMKLVIFKEIEQSKTLGKVFSGKSRFFRMFSELALSPVHFKSVVHPIMNHLKKDENGNYATLLGLVVDVTLKQNQVICFSSDDYKLAPQRKDRVAEYDASEIKNEFTGSIELIRRFILGDFLRALKQYVLPHYLLKIFDYALQEIKRRRYPDAKSNDDISAEMRMVSPMLYIVIMGIIVPMLKDPHKYASNEVYLGPCKELATDVDVIFNLERVCQLLEAVAVSQRKKDADASPYMESMAKVLRMELLKFMIDQVNGVTDDTDTQLTIDLYLSHFDRTPHVVSMDSPTLMRLSNMLSTNLSKLRLNQQDPVERLCTNIGTWTEDDIQAAEKEPSTHNFLMNTRFIFQDKDVVICNSSRCPVPPRLSAAFAGGAGAGESESRLVATFAGDSNSKFSGGAFLQELLCEIPALVSTTFDDIKDEMEKFHKDAMNKQPPNFALAKNLKQGIETITNLQACEATPLDVLEWMADAVTQRDRHKRYLEQVHTGIDSIRKANNRNTKLLREAESELTQALKFSRNLALPPVMVQMGRSQGKNCKFETVSKNLSDLKDFGRKGVKGTSYNPMISKSLLELRKERVVEWVDPWLDQVEQAGGTAQFTFILTEAGLDLTVSVIRSKAVKSNLHQMKISEEKLREMRQAERGSVVELPVGEKPIVKFVSTQLVAFLAKMANS